MTTAVTIAAAAAVALLIVVTLVWSRPGTRPTDREPGPGPLAAAPKPTPTPTPTAPVGRTDARVGAEDPTTTTHPVRVTLPTTDITAPVQPTGVTRDGQMELPPNPRVMGWYEYGTAPGDRSGSVVLAGHLDSTRYGLGPLARLRDTRPGDPVEVTLTDGTTRTYHVTTLERFDRQALPDFLFSRIGPEHLRIITCGGEYDAKAGGYQQNLVVTAIPKPNTPPAQR